MWFKRHKKSEQDHALSESLRSLQSLLSETGRREPSLDPGDGPPGDPGTEPPSEPRPPRASNSGSGARRPAAQGDGRSTEPGTPDSSGNRWRDLNLSFDAEPVLPRARRDSPPDAGEPDPQAETRDEAHTAVDSGDGPEALSVETSDQPVPDEAGHDPAAGSPETASRRYGDDMPVDAGEPAVEPPDLPEKPDVDDGDLRVPEPGPAVSDEVAYPAEPQVRADPPAAPGEDEGVAPGHEFRPRSEEEVLVLDLEEPELPPAETGADEADETFPDDEPDEPARHDPATPAGLRDTTVSKPFDEPAEDEQEEDQLHLELEPDAEADAGIPVLTNAVYVPDTPPEHPPTPAFTPPGPAGSPHDAVITRCIDNLSVRFQLMGLDALSPAQEKELHDALVEFLEDFQRG